MNEKLFNDIKDYQSDGVNSEIVSRQMKVSIETIENIYSSETLEEYMGKYESTNEEIVSPAKAGYYKGLVAKKAEENSNLKEQRAWLLEQVYFLRKTVNFLEFRKRELDDGIKSLEKNIFAGIGAMEQLEENENFTKLSKKTERLNK